MKVSRNFRHALFGLSVLALATTLAFAQAQTVVNNPGFSISSTSSSGSASGSTSGSTPPQSKEPEGSGPDCSVRGTSVISQGVHIYSARDGGLPIAGFSTQEVYVELSDFPADPTSARTKVRTGKGSGSFRIDGFIESSRIHFSAKQDVPVVSGHLWIGKGEVLKVKGASPGKLHVETVIAATQQLLKTKANCSLLAAGRTPSNEESDPPSNAQKWVLKNTSLELFDEPGASSSVFTLEVPQAQTGILLYSTEVKKGYVHVMHQGPYVIDAWARQKDLKSFPKKEMLDVLGSTNSVSISPAKLKYDGSVKEIKVSKNVPIRLSAHDAVKPIGMVEDGADILVLDSIAGWSRVLPKGLEIVAPDGKDFWVSSADIGISSK